MQVVLDQTLLNTPNFQNMVNFQHSENMYESLMTMLKKYALVDILRTDFGSQEEAARIYAIRSDIIRLACEYIEHTSKALIIQKHMENSTLSENDKKTAAWDEIISKVPDTTSGNRRVPKYGHNLLNLFRALDDDDRHTILNTLNLGKTKNYDTTIPAAKTEDILELTEIMGESGILSREEITSLYDSFKEILSSNDKEQLDRELKEAISNSSYSSSPSINVMVDHSVYLGESDILTQFGLTNHTSTAQELLVSSRYPGQTLIDGPIRFLLNYCHALHDISEKKKPRELREESNVSRGL